MKCNTPAAFNAWDSLGPTIWIRPCLVKCITLTLCAAQLADHCGCSQLQEERPQACKVRGCGRALQPQWRSGICIGVQGATWLYPLELFPTSPVCLSILLELVVNGRAPSPASHTRVCLFHDCCNHRSGLVNLAPTSTGSATAIALIFPELKVWLLRKAEQVLLVLVYQYTALITQWLHPAWAQGRTTARQHALL